MKRVMIIVIGVVFLVAAFSFARAPKSDYQWTGTVLEADSDHMIVQKGNEKWEFALDKDTKISGEPKVGARVTVYYMMKAMSIDVKEAAKKGEPKKAEPKKK